MYLFRRLIIFILYFMNYPKKMVGKFLAAAIVVTSLTSCYSTTTCVGTLPADAPMVKVNSTKNHFLIYGLVPISNTKKEDSKYVGKSKNYQVKKSLTFIDGLINVLTWGIYTPSTTYYYLPYEGR